MQTGDFSAELQLRQEDMFETGAADLAITTGVQVEPHATQDIFVLIVVLLDETLVGEEAHRLR